MTPQQWNNLEVKTLKPHLETVEIVARALEASVPEAMAAAGYVSRDPTDIPPSKATAIARAEEGLKLLDEQTVEEIADLISFKLSRQKREAK